MCLFHKWTEYKIERREYLEMRDGFLFPYVIQKRECKKCGLFDIKITRDFYRILAEPLEERIKYENKNED